MLLKSMSSEVLEVNGEWPVLENKIVEKLVAQEYWYKGELIEAANVIWLKISSKWYRLYFDCGIIFWRESSEEPSYAKLEADEDYDYPLNDLTKKFNLHNNQIETCIGFLIPGGSEVMLKFSNNKVILFRNIDDSTTIEILQTDCGN